MFFPDLNVLYDVHLALNKNETYWKRKSNDKRKETLNFVLKSYFFLTLCKSNCKVFMNEATALITKLYVFKR